MSFSSSLVLLYCVVVVPVSVFFIYFSIQFILMLFIIIHYVHSTNNIACIVSIYLIQLFYLIMKDLLLFYLKTDSRDSKSAVKLFRASHPKWFVWFVLDRLIFFRCGLIWLTNQYLQNVKLLREETCMRFCSSLLKEWIVYPKSE